MSAVAAALVLLAQGTPSPLPASVLLPAAQAIPAVSAVRPGRAIDRAMAQKQTGVFVLFNAGLVADGAVEALAVLADGQVLDAFARRRGVPLRRLASTLPLQLPPATGEALAGQWGIDQPITDPARRRAFLAQAGWRSGAQAMAEPRWQPAALPDAGLVYFDARAQPMLARWGFEYLPGRSFAFFDGRARIQWSLGG